MALVVFGARCYWWDSIDKVSVIKPTGLPCCPHCGGVLYEMGEEQWWAGADKCEREGRPGYRKLVEWWRGKCFTSLKNVAQAYKRETPNLSTETVAWLDKLGWGS